MASRGKAHVSLYGQGGLGLRCNWYSFLKDLPVEMNYLNSTALARREDYETVAPDLALIFVSGISQ